MRWLSLLVVLCIALPSHAVSLRESRLHDTLKQVASQSSEGTPRTLNDDIVDEGYSSEGTELINHLSVNEAYAEQLQQDPLVVRTQLQASVCADQRFRRLMDMGATLTYHFAITGSSQPVLTHSFVADHCQSL
ncbi:MAG: PA3611 family quorum-sensing-regulated virulence factor [Halopseudomonas sp.]